jgi:membrane protease YdiL (CAAX protease family)
MSEIATVGVLKDVLIWGMVALFLGVGVYGFLRWRWEGESWNTDGNVLSRPYDGIDGLVALGLTAFLSMGLFMGDASPPTDASAKAAMTAGTLLQLEMVPVMVCLILLLYMTLYRGLNPAEMFGLRQMTVGSAAIQAAISFILVYLVLLSVMNFLIEVPDKSDQELVNEFKKANSLTFKFVLGFAAVVIAPLTEELMFRGFLYGVTKRFTDRWFAAFFTSLIFAVMHHHLGSLIPLFMLALGLAVVYEITGCLLVTVFMHAMFNAWNLVQLIYQ